MRFEIGRREREGIPILDLKGRLVVGEPVASFRRAVAELVHGGGKGVVVNLEEVEYVDSSGLGALVLAHTEAEEAGSAMRLLNVKGRSVELIVMTKLETVFETFDNERDAVDSFFPNRDAKRFDILEFVRKQRGEA